MLPWKYLVIFEQALRALEHLILEIERVRARKSRRLRGITNLVALGIDFEQQNILLDNLIQANQADLHITCRQL